MIIDFSVKNFRSIKEEQGISFVASNYDKSLPQNLIDVQLPGLPGLKLLKGLAIYGANASGKTNVLKALHYLSFTVEESATFWGSGDTTGTEPFALDPEKQKEPSEFSLRFVVEKVRYHFTLILDEYRVLYETLSAFPKGKEQIWYERSWDERREVYDWKPERPTGFRRDPTIEDYTRDNALFLSTAVNLNNKDLEPIYLWFKNQYKYSELGSDFFTLSANHTISSLLENAVNKNDVIKLLQHADFGVLSAKANDREIRPVDLPDDTLITEITFGHRGKSGIEYPLDWEHESSGTRKFFALAGPWLEILENGYVICVDEIGSSMHTTMVAELLRLLFSDIHNKNGAQIIFTTHNSLLLDLSLLRRDQIWFTDKDDEGATNIYPLSDYKPRKNESLVRGYMAGRYGAVPFIPSGLIDNMEKVHVE